MRAWLAPAGGGISILLISGALVGAEKLETVSTADGEAPAAALPAATPETAATPEMSAAPAAPTTLRHGVFRFTSYPAAWTAAQKSNRPILIFATAPGCAHCVKMLNESYRTPKISHMVNDSFETVCVDRLEQPELAAKLHVKWFPTTIIVAPDNKVLDVIEGYVDPATLAQRLRTTFAAHAASTLTRK